MRPKVTDVERLKKQVRQLAAGRVLSGGGADVYLELARLDGCQARIAAGYGSPSKTAHPVLRDRLIWILDGYAEIYDASGQMVSVSQGDSLVLPAGQAYRLTFPQLSIYLRSCPRTTSKLCPLKASTKCEAVSGQSLSVEATGDS